MMLADGACAQAFFLEADASLDLAVGGPDFFGPLEEPEKGVNVLGRSASR